MRWARAEAYRHTAAAVARLRLSALPWIGTRTTASASARVSSGRPQASLPKIQAVGPPMVPASSSSSRSSSPAPVGGEDAYPGVPQPLHGLLDGYADGDRQMEERTDRGAHGLGVVQVDGGVGQDDRVGAGGVRAAQYGAGVAGVADVREHGDQLGPRLEDLLERRVQEPADPDEPLRGDGLRDLGEHLVVRVVHPGPGVAGGGHDVRVPLRGLDGGEQLDERALPPTGAPRPPARPAAPRR